MQTLDYLGYVLAADPAWGGKQRLTQAPDLQSAAAFTAYVATRADYEAALSGVWNVVAQMTVPPIPTEVANDRYEGKQPGSIARLDFWLVQRLGADSAALDRVSAALQLVRAVGRVRTEPQHASAGARADAIKARQKLGLPEVVWDYSEAWALVCDRLAGAFDVIRQEVQAAPKFGSAP